MRTWLGGYFPSGYHLPEYWPDDAVIVAATPRPLTVRTRTNTLTVRTRTNALTVRSDRT